MKRIAFAIELALSTVVATFVRRSRRGRREVERVLITGWYGSETVGDVAILGQIIREIRATVPNATIRVATFDVLRTVDSLAQLGETHVEAVKVGVASGWAQGRCDLLIFGGGPLMESPSMRLWLTRARICRWSRARVVVHSCGIGPIRTDRTAHAVRLLVAAADLVMVRDDDSAQFIENDRHDDVAPVVTFDPAYDYVTDRPDPDVAINPMSIVLALRYPSPQYVGSDRSTAAWRTEFARTIASTLDRLASDGYVFTGAVMYEDTNESDRLVYADVRAQMDRPEALAVPTGPHTVDTVATMIDGAAAVLAVRFHGFIFALARDKPVVAIDYSVPSGKTTAAAERYGALESVIDLDDATPAELTGALRRALAADRASRPVSITQGSERRVAALREMLGPEEDCDAPIVERAQAPAQHADC